MIKINVNGNRSDIIGYVSYYSCEEIAELLDVSQDEIIYETTIVDYFLHGDITFDNEIIVKVTITDNYTKYVEELTNIIIKYVSYFTNKCQVYYEVIDSSLVFLYEDKNRKVEEDDCCCNHECHCHDDGECHCGDECHCCDDGGECRCGDSCHCHDEKEHKCNCHNHEEE